MVFLVPLYYIYIFYALFYISCYKKLVSILLVLSEVEVSGIAYKMIFRRDSNPCYRNLCCRIAALSVLRKQDRIQVRSHSHLAAVGWHAQLWPVCVCYVYSWAYDPFTHMFLSGLAPIKI